MSTSANSWLCSHVIFPAIALRRLSLLPTSWLQRLWEKCENIWDKKNYIKENNPKSSASNCKNWVWNVYILTEPAWKCCSHGLNHAREIYIYYFIAISRWKGKFLSRLNINASRGWPLNGVLTNPFLFFLLDFFFFLSISLIPSENQMQDSSHCICLMGFLFSLMWPSVTNQTVGRTERGAIVGGGESWRC